MKNIVSILAISLSLNSLAAQDVVAVSYTHLDVYKRQFVGNLKGILSMMKSTSPIYINVKGQLIDLSIPQVMGILNVTPDSFYAGSRMQTEEDLSLIHILKIFQNSTITLA